MATNVVMPQMGESIAEGTIVRWIKKVGDNVDRDEPLFEISTDKVDAEIPSPGAGVLTEIKVKEGETVPVNTRRRGDRRIRRRRRARRRRRLPPSGRRRSRDAGSRGRAARDGRAVAAPAADERCRRRAGVADEPADGSRRDRSKSCGGRSRRRSCAGSRKSTTSTSGRSTAPGSAAA